MIKTKEFENGLKLVVEEVPNVHSVSMGVMVNVGSMRESEKTNGLSHLIEHMMFKGTEKRGTFEISDSMTRIGGKMNAFTGKDVTCYHTKVIDENAEHAFEIISDMLLNSKFDPVELDKERKVVVEEITMYEDNPAAVCDDLYWISSFGNTSIGRGIAGPKENILETSREDILKYKNEFYTSENMVVSFAGNISFEKAEEYVKKYFLDFLPRGKKAEVIKKEVFLSEFNSKVKEIEQSHIMIGFEGLELNHEEEINYKILARILGGGMSGRLFKKIREEKGMAYTVRAGTDYFLNNGSIAFYAGTNPENINEVFNLIKEELINISENGITDDEFEREKTQVKASLLFGIEDIGNLMVQNAFDFLVLEKIFEFDERIKKINNSNKDSVNKLAKELFVLKNASAAVVTNKEIELEELEKIFKE